ncbi:quinolinate synthase NadA, partial [Candidatus Woesearchaeota archaeon]|nr:quinolinate synthase NadA [Candidatus Woesearchaeota archaeon]
RLADHICGTGGMITYARENPAKEFIIATESGMVNRLKREVPDKEFYSFGTICFNQKFIHLEDVKTALEKLQNRIELSPEIMEKALVPIRRMLEF